MTEERNDQGRSERVHGDRNQRGAKGLIITGPLAPVEDENTELVAMPARRSRTMLLVAAGAGAALVVALVLVLFAFKSESDKTEDALTLYQVAKELYSAEEFEAALQMLERARRVAESPRARRQIDELERIVRTAPGLKRAQRFINVKSYAAAQIELEAVLKQDPGNEKAMLLLRLIPKKGEAPPASPSAAKPPPQAAAVAAPPASVAADDTTRRTRKVRRRPARRRRGTLLVDSTIEGHVFVDGTRRGRSPVTIALTPGPHVIELVALIDPNIRVKRRVVVSAGRSSRLRLDLPAPQPAEPEEPQTAQPEATQPEGAGRPAPGGDPRMPPTDNLNPWSR